MLAKKGVPNQRRCPRCNGYIGHVEGRPVKACPMEVEKVDHGAHQYPIDDIAHCAAYD